jgi:hypothetical protein
VARLLPTMKRYQRNYPNMTGGPFLSWQSAVPYDALTQVWFEDRAAFETYKETLRYPEIAKAVRDDQAHFLDHTKSMWFVVDEHNSSAVAPTGKVKVIVLLSRLPHLTRAQFKDYYENNHAKLTPRLFKIDRRYQRNYPDPTQAEFPKGMTDTPFDSVTQSWYDDEADYEKFRSLIRDPEILRTIQEDETHFLDTKRSIPCRVDECDSDLPALRSKLHKHSAN